MEEYFLLQLFQQLGRASAGWLEAALLVGLLVALIYRPERIARPAALKWACWLLALSIALPPLLNALATSVYDTAVPSRPQFFGAPSPPMRLLSVTTALGPVLFGASLLLGLFSLIPRNLGRGRPGPTRHPLE